MSEPVNCTDSELCTFLQALVEGYLPTYYSDTIQSAQSKLMPIASKVYQQGRKTVAFPGFPSLEILKDSTESPGGGLSILSQEDSLVRTSPAQEQTAELTEPGAGLMGNTLDSGVSRGGSFAKYSPDTRLWKTAQPCLFSGLIEFSGTWPRWGLMRRGECYLRENVERPMNAKGCGLWLPTPTAHNAKEGNYPAERTRNTPTLAAVLGGKINPEYTEWMMGWPIGWTDLKPLAMDKFQSWLQQHSASFLDNKP